ncbi:MAG: hypothetical protein LUQ51_04575, partial [Methanothrix sp.]|nr:hypothetical protein [Methanothrix sp.]
KTIIASNNTNPTSIMILLYRRQILKAFLQRSGLLESGNYFATHPGLDAQSGYEILKKRRYATSFIKIAGMG